MNSIRNVTKLAAAVIASLTLIPAANATDYVVDRSNKLASDTNPGSLDLPFLSISRAVKIARAGDNILVKAGTYNEAVTFANSGAPGAPITLSASGNVVVEPLSPRQWTGGINILGKTDIQVSGFTVKNTFFGIQVDKNSAGAPSERVVIRNNHALLSQSSGIRVAMSKDVTVVNNVVEKTNYGGKHEMISIINTDGFDVNGNEVFNGTFLINGVAMEGKEGIDAKEGSRNGRIRNNKVHDLVRLGIYLDAWDKSTYNIEVSGNTVYRCKQGIALASEAGGTLSDVRIFNNVTYNNVNFGIIVTPWVSDGPRYNVDISHNTAFGNGRGGISIATRNVSLVTLRNNISANNNGPQLATVSSSLISASSNNLVSGKNLGNIKTGTLVGDPRFANAAAGDFRLATGSAAANSGVTLKTVTQDIVGTWRPLGGAYDIGAFESK